MWLPYFHFDHRLFGRQLMLDSQNTEDETEDETGITMQQAKQRVQLKLNEDAMSGGTTDADLTTTGEATADASGLTTEKTMLADDEASVPATSRSVATPRSK